MDTSYFERHLITFEQTVKLTQLGISARRVTKPDIDRSSDLVPNSILLLKIISGLRLLEVETSSSATRVAPWCAVMYHASARWRLSIWFKSDSVFDALHSTIMIRDCWVCLALVIRCVVSGHVSRDRRSKFLTRTDAFSWSDPAHDLCLDWRNHIGIFNEATRSSQWLIMAVNEVYFVKSCINSQVW